MSFKILTTDELIEYTKNFKWARKFSEIQIHHTWKPEHKDFNGNNGIQLQESMKNYHVNSLGWQTIGQHLSLLPNGKWVTGRDFNIVPASIAGRNSLCFLAIEMIGNFDIGHDKLKDEQLNSIIKFVNWGIIFFNLGVKGIVFHREYASKSCPGTGIDKKWFVDKVINYKEIKVEKEEKEIKNMLEQWQIDLGNKAIDDLIKEGIIDSPEQWKNKLENNCPNWLLFILLQRILNKLQK